MTGCLLKSLSATLSNQPQVAVVTASYVEAGESGFSGSSDQYTLQDNQLLPVECIIGSLYFMKTIPYRLN